MRVLARRTYVRAVMEGVAGPGGTLTFNVPFAVQQPAPGVIASPVRFTLNLAPGSGAPSGWVRATGCSGGSWPFLAMATLTDGATQMASRPQSCSAGPPVTTPTASRPVVTKRPPMRIVRRSGRYELATGWSLACPAGGPACSATLSASARRGDTTTSLGLTRLAVVSGRATPLTLRIGPRGIAALKRGAAKITANVRATVGTGDPVTAARSATLRLPKR